MRRPFVWCACLTASVFSTSMHASTIGNGGKVFVKLLNSHSEEALLVDYFEGKTLSGVTPDFTGLSGAPEQIASQAFLRLKNVDPALTKEYSERAISMMGDSAFLDDIDLTNIDDVLNTEAPTGFELVQAAVHRGDVLPGQKAFIFDNKHWRSLSDTDKVGLLMHEVIYEHFVTLGETNSVRARYLNYMIASNAISSWKPKDFLKFMAGLPETARTGFVHWNGFAFYMAGVQFYPNGFPHYAQSAEDFFYEFKENGELNRECDHRYCEGDPL